METSYLRWKGTETFKIKGFGSLKQHKNYKCFSILEIIEDFGISPTNLSIG